MYNKIIQLYICAKSLCNPVDYSLPGSSVHGILQARILEWVVIPFGKGIFPIQGSNPCLLCLLHWQVGSLPLVPPGNIYLFFLPILFPIRLLQNIEQSSLCYTAGPCWLSILNIAVYTCQSQTH